MNARDFFDLVSDMRQAQKEYFKTRDKEVLVKSKELEKRVDDEIKRVVLRCGSRTGSKLLEWLTVLKDVQTEYSGRTLDNIIDNVEARVKDYETRNKQ